MFSFGYWDIENSFAKVAIGLFRKAHHPRDQLLELYGSLMDVKCSDSADTGCTHIEEDNIDEPVCLCPALATSGTELQPLSYEQPTVQSRKIKSQSSRGSNISEMTEQAHNEKTRNCDMQKFLFINSHTVQIASYPFFGPGSTGRENQASELLLTKRSAGWIVKSDWI